MKFSLFVACILTILPAALSPVGAQNITWHEDLESASKIAADENKLVLLHFSAEWCRPCKALETFVFSSPEVQTAMRQNVVAVKIDVDADPNLVKEYGVSGVPFDIAITPQGRVVSKRSSPRDASSYGTMINGFSRVINCLQSENPALMEQLNQFGAQDTASKKVIRNQSFKPAKPSHTSPLASNASFELKRKSRVSNPYALAAQSRQEMKPAPKAMRNQFVTETPVTGPEAGSRVASRDPAIKQRGQLEFAHSLQKPSSITKEQPANRVANKEIKNQFFAMQPVSKKQNASANNPSPPALDNSQNVTALASMPNTAPVSELKAQTVASESLYPFKSSLNDVTKKLMPQITSSSATPLAKHVPQPSQHQQLPDSTTVGDPPQTDFPSHIASTTNPPNLAGTENAGPAKVLAAQNEFAKDMATLKPAKSVQQVIAETTTPKKKPVQVKAEAKLVLPQTKIVKDSRFFEDDLSSKIAANPAQDTTGDKEVQPDSQSTLPDQMLTKKTPSEQFALKGKCPVNLLKTGTWVDGNPKWGCVHRNKTYLFSSEANLNEFQSDPETYSPLLAGFDPVIFHQEGELVDGLEEHGVFMGKSPKMRVILFSSAKTRATFQANPKAYINTIRQATRSTGGASSNILR